MPKRRTTRVLWLLLGIVYVLGVWLGNASLEGRIRGKSNGLWSQAVLPPMSDDGPVAGEPLSQNYWAWNTDSSLPPVILLHGSPGSASNFFGRPGSPGLGELVASGRPSYAIDLPGMGNSRRDPPTWSSRSHAHAVLAFMDEIHADRAHIVGWSNGGAVAINMADIAPDRLASITLLGSVGAQETEGSGGYWFEHAKYGIGILATHAAERLLPHFGILDLWTIRGGLRNFDDTDQRPLARIMQRLTTPTLILHGRDDFLVADWAAEYHHGLMPGSRLVMTPHDHFMPFLAAADTAEHISGFIELHDEPGVPAVGGMVDESPRVHPFGSVGEAFLGWLHFAPWMLVVPLVALAGHAFGLPGRAWVCVLVGASELDIGVAWLGLAIGKGARTIRHGNARRPTKWLLVLLEPMAQLAIGFFFVQLFARPLIRFGPDWSHGIGWAVTTLLLALLFRVLPSVWTTRGRQRLLASLSRLLHHEWWPMWALYLPLVPWLLWLSIRHRHPLAFTACNPGMPNGGGLAGESKSEIIDALLASGDDRVLFGARIGAGATPEDRASEVERLLGDEPMLGGLPVVMKPDAGEQGRGVKLCKSMDDVLSFFRVTPGVAQAQRYHAGPCEVGVFFVRDGGHGRIFSINRKRFPVLTGDGRRTIEQLVWEHRRLRCQAGTFLARFGPRLGEVLPAGEELRLSLAGNHRQGCSFHDGPDLITPELDAAVCAIADGFTGTDGGGLDFGRFDLRFTDEAALLRGEFGVVEVNGVTSESANLYDPARSPLFAWRTLARQWSLAYAIGAQRMSEGHRPVSIWGALRMAASHFRSRSTLGIAT